MSTIRVVDIGAVRQGRVSVPLPDLAVDGPGLLHIVGPNGAGKSTMVEVLAGTLVPRFGTVEIAGQRAHSLQARRSRTVTRSEQAFMPGVTLARHAQLFARAGGVSADRARAALVDAALERCLQVPVGALSTGQRQRAWIELTTLRDAAVRILDEPFLGLDEGAAGQVSGTIERWATAGLVVLVDHDARHVDGAAMVVEIGAK